MTDARTPKVTQPAKQDPKAQKQEVEFQKDVMQACGGSTLDAFNLKLLNDVIGCIWVPPAPDGDIGKASRQVTTALIGAMTAFEPKDEIEGMIAAQAVALHHASMECLRRAMLGGQPAEISSKLRKDGANLARGMTDMLAALDRKRGKGQQHIRVERVMVADGGQAVVGNVTTGATSPKAVEHHAAKPMEPLLAREKEGVGE